MTTLAFDGKTLATDSLITQDGVRVGLQSKITKVRNGVLAIAGSLEDGMAAAEWLDNQDLPKPTLDAFVGLLLLDDGAVVELNEKLTPMPITPPWAGGSGWQIALTAMTLGKTAPEAVAASIKLDIFSGGDINTWTVGERS